MALLVLGSCAETDLSRRSQAPHDSASKSPIGAYKVGNPYQVAGVWYYPKEDYRYRETGIASWYGPGFHGKNTANGEIYDENDLTAAHRTLPMPSLVRVTNLDNGRSIVVRVNDRGPFSNGRIIDMSRRSAQLLGFERHGTTKVEVEILEAESRQLVALAQGLDMAQAAPPAVPTTAVTSAPLPADGSGRWPIEIVPVSVGGGAPQARGATPPWPDGQVSRRSVTTSNLYIQAGAFLRRDYAARLSARLSGLASAAVTPVEVGSQRFYRVRLGPIASVEDADRLLETLITEGHDNARVVVD